MRSTFRRTAAAALLFLVACDDPTRPRSQTEGTFEAQITGDINVSMRGFSVDGGIIGFSHIVMGRDPMGWKQRPDTLIYITSRTFLQRGTHEIRPFEAWDNVPLEQPVVIAYAVVSAPGGRPRYISLDGTVTITKVTRRGREGTFSFRAPLQYSSDPSRSITVEGRFETLYEGFWPPRGWEM